MSSHKLHLQRKSHYYYFITSLDSTAATKQHMIVPQNRGVVGGNKWQGEPVSEVQQQEVDWTQTRE